MLVCQELPGELVKKGSWSTCRHCDSEALGWIRKCAFSISPQRRPMLAVYHSHHVLRLLGGARHIFCLSPLSLGFLICEMVTGSSCRAVMN